MRFSSNNHQMRRLKATREQNHFSLRKLSVGFASVLLATTFLAMGNQVKADVIDNTSSQEIQTNTGTNAETSTATQADAATDTTNQTQISQAKTANQETSLDTSAKSTATASETATTLSAAKTTDTATDNTTKSEINAATGLKVNKAELENRFTYSIDSQGNAEITGLKADAGLRDGGVLVLPNAQDFIDAGEISAGHTAKITTATLWHMIWDDHSEDMTELDVSNNGNSKLTLIQDGPNSPFANNSAEFDDYSTEDRSFNIQKMNLNNLDVSQITNFSKMFSEASSLTSLDIGDWDVSNGTDFSWMFKDSELPTVDVSKWDVSNGTNFSWMFQDSDMKSLDVSKWNVAKGTRFSGMFDSASELTSLDVANWDVSNATNMMYMFSSDLNLKHLDVSKWNVSNVKNFKYMFADTTSLSALDVSKWNVANATNFSDMFNETNVNYLNLSNWKMQEDAETEGMFLDTKMVVKTKKNDPILNYQNANSLLSITYEGNEQDSKSAISPITIKVNHNNVNSSSDPTTQDLYFMDEDQIQDLATKVNAKITSGNEFFKRYQTLVNEVKNEDNSNEQLGNEIKAVKVLADLAEIDSTAKAESGYQYTGLESSTDSTIPADILTASYTLDESSINSGKTDTSTNNDSSSTDTNQDQTDKNQDKQDQTDKNDHKLNPIDKVPVKDPKHLSDSEKDQVKKNITDSNKDKDISQIIVNNDGSAIITFSDGSKKTLTAKETILVKPKASTGGVDSDKSSAKKAKGRSRHQGTSISPKNTTSTTQSNANLAKTKSEKALPATGQANEVGLVLVGLMSLVLGLFGFKKSKEK